MKELVYLLALIFLGSAAKSTSVSAQDFRNDRLTMVRTQLEPRGIANPAVLRAMRTVPRHEFVPESERRNAYADRPVPIGYGQTISQPFIVGYMTEMVLPRADSRVLEIGTGSGYQAAVLAAIVDTVFTMEIIPELASSATARLKRLGYQNVQVRNADGYHGWPEAGPFDAIVVTAAAQHIPPPLIKQLKEGGRMIIPVGTPFLVQSMMLVEKSDGETSTSSLIPVRFVPFRRSNK